MRAKAFSLSLGREAQRTRASDLLSILLAVVGGGPLGVTIFLVALILFGRLTMGLPGGTLPGWLATPVVIATTVVMAAGLVGSLAGAIAAAYWLGQRLITSPVELHLDEVGLHLRGRRPVMLRWDAPITVALGHSPFEPARSMRVAWLEGAAARGGGKAPPPTHPADGDRFVERFSLTLTQGRQRLTVRTQREVTRAAMRESATLTAPPAAAWHIALSAPTAAQRWAALRTATAAASEGLAITPAAFLDLLVQLHPHAASLAVD